MGVWRTIKGSRVYIEEGQSVAEAIKNREYDSYKENVSKESKYKDDNNRTIRFKSVQDLYDHSSGYIYQINKYNPDVKIFTDNEGPYLTNTRLGTKIRGLKRINQEFENKEYSMDKQ